MRKRPFRRKLIALALAGVLAGAVGGTVAAFSATTASSGNTFSAAASFSSCETLSAAWITGLEHGVVSTSGGGLFDNAVSATADAAVKRTGAYSLRLDAVSGSPTYAAKLIGGSTLVMRFALHFPSLPPTDVAALAGTYVSAGTNLQLGYRAADKKLTLSWGGTNLVASTDPIAAGTWYVIDMRAEVGLDPRTASWRIDGVAQPDTASAEPAALNHLALLGSLVASDAYTAHFDDIVASSRANDYPLGGGRVFALRPDGVAVHSGAGNFTHENGTAIDANSWTRLREVPMSSAAESVQQRAANGTSYLGFTFENPVHSCVRAVSAVLAFRATSGTGGANSGKTSIFDGSTERVLFSGDMRGTPLQYKSAVIAPASSPWSQTAVNGLFTRLGYATDVNPVPSWESLLLEYETPGS